MREALSNHLASFRSWSYERLTGHVEDGPFWKPQDCLDHIEGIAADGTQYQMEFNVDWINKAGEAIIVSGSLFAEPQKRLWGFLPLYSADVTDSFVVEPNVESDTEGDSEPANKTRIPSPITPRVD